MTLRVSISRDPGAAKDIAHLAGFDERHIRPHSTQAIKLLVKGSPSLQPTQTVTAYPDQCSIRFSTVTDTCGRGLRHVNARRPVQSLTFSLPPALAVVADWVGAFP